jgi:DnaJ-class molecular chaperone
MAKKTCSECGGSGEIEDDEGETVECPECGGTGESDEEEEGGVLQT